MADEIMLTVDGVALPCPSSFTWGLNDVSLGESGRTENAEMQKNRVAQKRKLEISWNGLTWQQCSQILQAVNPEYIEVQYPDLMSGEYETRTFYVGDRSAPFKSWYIGGQRVESLSFDFIER